MSKTTLTPEDLKAIGKIVLSKVEECLKTFGAINAANVNELMTVDELAEKLKQSKQTIYKLIKENDLNSIKIGKQIYIKATDFNDYINKNSYDNR